MNNLEPRAKIGDVVIYREYNTIMAQALVISSRAPYGNWEYKGSDTIPVKTVSMGVFMKEQMTADETTTNTKPIAEISFTDEDILKNLTTNVSYE